MNLLETKVKQELEQDGWTVLRRGWPDFLCFRKTSHGVGHEIKAVEVKPLTGSVGFKVKGSEQTGLSPYQKTVLSILKQFMPTEVHYGSGEGIPTRIRNCRLNLWESRDDEVIWSRRPRRTPEFNGLGVS